MLRSKLPLVLLFLIVAASSIAQNRPPHGTGIYYDLISPVFLAMGDNTVSPASPAADFLNPASSALIQRPVISASYLTITGTPESEGLAHIGNIGLSVPASFGVFSGSLHYIASPFDSFDFGNMGSLGFSFSKALYPHLLVGLGMTAHAGSNDKVDWGLGLNLGFLHLAGDLGFLKDFRWGGTVREIGKGYAAVDNRSAFPAPFTPSLGASFKLVQSDSFYWGLAGDIAFPSFQSLKINTATELGIGDNLLVHASFPIDPYEWSKGERRYPAFGLTVRFKIGGNSSDASLGFGAAPLNDGHWALGAGFNLWLGTIDVVPPVIELGETSQYISPNADGEKDVLVVPISIEEDRLVLGYQFVVTDENGDNVRQIKNKEERPPPTGIIDRLTYVEKGITIPPVLRWDGRKDDGSVVPDGQYRYFVEAWDDNENRGKSEVRIVHIDNTAPQVQLGIREESDLVFSPNGDGNKDSLSILQSGSTEDLWAGGVFDSEGRLLRSFSWKNVEPQNFEWDGKDDSGLLAADGVYVYRIECTDRAGNKAQATMGNIVLNTQATPIRIVIDKSDFSPNGDGIKDSILFETEAARRSDIREWRLEVRDSSGRVVKMYSGSGTLPAYVNFNGRDNRGALLPEGSYWANMEILYVNGNNPKSRTPRFNLDLTPPMASVRISAPIFSPNGDGLKDYVTVTQETSLEDIWYGVVSAPDGAEIARFQWRGNADAEFRWDGLDDAGRLVRDGEYTYRLFAVDRAGNTGSSHVVACTLDTEETPVILFASEKEFSPNGDGIRDRITLIPQVKKKTGVSTYELQVTSESGKMIRRISGVDSIPAGIEWDGLSETGAKIDDGLYTAQIEVVYDKGDRSIAKSPAFLVDTIYPNAKVEVREKLFSPNNDGEKDSLEITQSSSVEALWVANIYNSEGQTVKSAFWKGSVESLIWDGRDENGNIVADGTYSYRLASTDGAGNTATFDVLNIRVDTVPTPIFVTLSSGGFSPNGDDDRDTIDISLFANVSKGIESWNLSLKNEETLRAVKTFSGATIPRMITWDGRSDSGEIANGIYFCEFTVTYSKGNRPVERSHRFRLDTEPPKVQLNTAPTPFSPDNDGIDDDCIISIEVDDLSSIDKWEIQIRDPRGNDFTKYGGTGTPAETIIWEGRADWGERVQGATDYALELTIEDEFRNKATIQHKIPVDILIDAKGEGFRIVISSFVFDGDTDQLVSGSEINSRILERLVETLKRYERHSVLIEAHELNSAWPDREKALKEESRLGPLSEQRARSIMKALVNLGIAADRLETAGYGGRQPEVPHDDINNRWKNRRIEIILTKGNERSQ